MRVASDRLTTATPRTHRDRAYFEPRLMISHRHGYSRCRHRCWRKKIGASFFLRASTLPRQPKIADSGIIYDGWGADKRRLITS